MLLYWLVVIALLLMPGSKLPKINWFPLIGFDKVVHFGLFGMLTFFSASIYTSNTRLVCINIALCCFAFGVTIEFVQEAYITNRSFDVYDILADGLGVLSAYLILIKFSKK